MVEEQREAQAEAQPQDEVEPHTRLNDRGEALRLGDSPLQSFLIASVVTALVMGLIVFTEISSPNSAWRFLPYIVFAVAIEAIITTRWLGDPQRRYVNRAGYRAAEFVAIAVVLRVLSWLAGDGFPDAETVRGYLLAPLSFLDGVYLVYLLCAGWGWERAIRFSSLFLQLRLTHAEVDYYSLPLQQRKERYPDRPIDRERPYVFADLTRSWLGGGFLLAIFAAMTSIDIPASLEGEFAVRSIGRLGLRPEILFALLVYFLVGLWLLSQARLSMVRARWLADGVASRPGVIASWHRASMLLLLLVAVIAAFLPIGSTFAAATILNTIIAVIAAGIQILFYVLSLISLFLASLFFTGEQPPEVLPTPEPQPTPMPTPEPAPVSETPALIIGGLFWILVGAVALIALIVFLRDRGVQLPEGALARWWQTVRSWFNRLLHGATQNLAGAGRAVARRLRTVRGPEGSGQSPWRFIRVNALPPREQVRYYYLSTVRRAGEQGVNRADSETPSEYARDLKENWPEAQQEIDALTAAFLEARYSPRQFESEDVSPVKAVWKRVRNSLRRRRQAGLDLSAHRQVLEDEEDHTNQEHVEDNQRDTGIDELQ
jgi:hypothetical protein